MLLSECTGDDIWSIPYCQQRLVPQSWIDQCRDGYESGFNSTQETIYYHNKPVNQFEGIRDVDLACKLGVVLGIDVSSILARHRSRRDVVLAIQEAVEED